MTHWWLGVPWPPPVLIPIEEVNGSCSVLCISSWTPVGPALASSGLTFQHRLPILYYSIIAKLLCAPVLWFNKGSVSKWPPCKQLPVSKVNGSHMIGKVLKCVMQSFLWPRIKKVERIKVWKKSTEKNTEMVAPGGLAALKEQILGSVGF